MSKEKLKAASAKIASASAPKGGSALSGTDKATFVFGKDNYKLLLIGIGLVALGMILMVGGAAEDPNIFSEDIFNFQRLTFAPVLIVAGYVVVLLAILKRPKE